MCPTALEPVRTEIVQLTRAQATKLTEKIRTNLEQTWNLLLEARDKRAWAALDYSSFESYAHDEFGVGRSQAYRLLDQAVVIGELTAASATSNGTAPDPVVVSARAAQLVKPVLEQAAAEVREAVKRKRGKRRTEAAQTAVENLVARQGAISSADTRRLIAAVREWAARNGVTFTVAVDRVVGRLEPPVSRARDSRGAARQCDGVHHPPGLRMGDTCSGCGGKYK